MRWLSYFILVYLVLALQMALSGYVSWAEASPNFVLPAVIFITINARREEALVGAFLLGAMQDLFSQQPPGVYAFSYAIVGLFVVGAQFVVYRDHPLTHLFVTLLAAMFVGAVVLFNQWVYPRLHGISAAASPSVGRAFLRAIYTAALAPVMLAGLVRLKSFFGFRGGRAPSSASTQSLMLQQ